MTTHLFPPMSRFICVGVMVLRTHVCLAQRNTQPVELTWEAPKECPQDPEVQQQLRQFVGKGAGDKVNSFQAHGSIAPLDDHYRLTLLIEKGATHGSRIIDSDDCRSLAKAAAIVLALLVQKERLLGRELSENEISGRLDEPQPQENPASPVVAPASPAGPTPSEEIPGAQAPRPGDDSSAPVYFLLRGPQVKVDFATLPQLGYGIGLGGGIAYQSWRALLVGTYYFRESVTSSGLHPYRIEYDRLSADALGCYGWALGSSAFELAPCGVVTADRVSAHASGDYLVSQDKSAFWISMGAGLSGYLHLSRHAALSASITGRITTNRAELLVGAPEGTARAYRVPLGVLDFALASEWIF